MNQIKNQTYNKERSLYNLKDTLVDSCLFFDEENIAESPLKESSEIQIQNCNFKLRYPCWHLLNSKILSSTFEESCRAAFWYDLNLMFKDCKFFGVKALRECQNITIDNCEINSAEFGWRCKNININNSSLTSEYPFFGCKLVNISNFKMKGKYSFQYCKNVGITDSVLDTKDAFWHSKNCIIANSEINGEYIGWYSSNLTFINCKIKGTQPFCYCKNLKLIDCQLIDGDLAFEYSSVKADIKGEVLSIKNPISGYIKADKIGKVILENSKHKCKCKITQK